MCFKLMGFEDYQYEKCREVIVKDRDLYNRAGNSIVVDASSGKDIAEHQGCSS